MATITLREIKKGSVVLFEDQPYQVVDRSLRAKQQREAMATVIMRNLVTGKILEKNFQSSDTIEEVDLDETKAQFLYRDGDEYFFMDQETYDQFSLNKSQLRGSENYLKEEIEIKIVKFKDVPVEIILPPEVSLKVVDAPPGVKGDTAQGGSKTVTLETGMTINVPLHIKEGDVLVIKTKTGNFDRRE